MINLCWILKGFEVCDELRKGGTIFALVSKSTIIWNSSRAKKITTTKITVSYLDHKQ